MKTSQRQSPITRSPWFYIAIAISVVVLLTLLAAPSNSKLRSGSTYNRAPDGYGAWYHFMEQRGSPVRRWQRPFGDLLRSSTNKAPLTLVQIHSRPSAPALDPQEQGWVEQGNTLVSLGVASPVTAANFHTLQSSPVGTVKIDTRRRLEQLAETDQQRLGDRFGAVVWQQEVGKGRAIFATTPNLAANAYQDYPGNYQFLAQLVTQNNTPIWVDEYIHGYKAADVVEQSAPGNWVIYLASTPLLPVFCQAGILLLTLIWAKNRRLGPPLASDTAGINNSQAYIQALADVLHKAESSEFIWTTVGKAEQQRVQSSLGLEQGLLDHPQLIDAWVQQTGRPAVELEQILRPSARRISQSDLLVWLRNIETVRRHLPSANQRTPHE